MTSQSEVKYIPLGKSSPAEANLFANEAEYFMHTIDVHNNTQIFTVLDNFSIGKGSDFTADNKAPQTTMVAEELTITGEFTANHILISTHHITSGDSASLNVSGEPIDPLAPAQSGDGNSGSPGNSAGTIKVYTEAIPTNTDGKTALPQLLAVGGNGQEGQIASNGTGGDGGKGGSGGNVTVYLSSAYLNAIDTIDQAMASLDSLLKIDVIVSALKPFDQTIILANNQQLSEATQQIDALGKEFFLDSNHHTKKKTSDRLKLIEKLNQIVVSVKNRFYTLNDSLKNEFLKNILTHPGEPGRGGTGEKGTGATGTNGSDPSQGIVQICMYSNTAGLEQHGSQQDNITAIVTTINPTQCQMLLQKAKMRYLQADSVSNPDDLTDTGLLFQRLMERLAFVPNLQQNGKMLDPRLAPYQNVYNEASAYFANFSKGLDYYGHRPNVVPLVALNIYKKSLSDLLNNFKGIEKTYAKYFEAIQKQNESRVRLSQAQNAANSVVAQAQSNISDLDARLDNVGSTIARYDNPIKQKQQVLDNVLHNVVSDIKNYYNFTFADGFSLFKDLIGALSSVAFMPESGFMSGIQGISFVGDMINTLGLKPTTTIEDDSGRQVNKDYLVNQVKAIQDTTKGLSEGYAQLDNGQLQPNDPGAAKLLMQESHIEKILNDYKSELPDDIQAVKKAFQDYIQTIVARNNKIMEYNAIVNILVTNRQQELSARDVIDRLTNKSFDSLDPGLPDVVVMMSKLYHQSRDQLMNTYYLASRALQFWALSNTNFLANSLASDGGGLQPTAINYAFISNTLHSAWLTALGDFRTEPSNFPNDDTEDGAIIVFKDDATLNSFKTVRRVIVRVPPIRRKDNTSPTQSDALDPIWENQLLNDQANIRLLEVRVWLDDVKIIKNGAEVNDVIQIRVTHSGQDIFVSQDNYVFNFSHDSISKTFEYFTKSKSSDNPNRPQIDKAANFGDLLKDDPTQGVNFALISPFTDWTIELVNTIQDQKETGLLTALKEGSVKKGDKIKYDDQTQVISSIDRDNDGNVTIIIKLLGITIKSFVVKGDSVTDEKGKLMAEPKIIQETSNSYIDLSGLTAIRLEFTGTSYTFNH